MRVSLAQAADALRRKAEALGRSTRTANATAARETLQEARRMSSGPFSSRALRAMGHPYARRRPRPGLPAAIINVQTGAFRAAWRIEGTGDSLRLANRDRKARLFPRGTRTMIARPIVRELVRRMRAKRLSRLQQATQRALEFG